MQENFDEACDKVLCITGATGYLAANFLNFDFLKLRKTYKKVYLLDRSLKFKRLCDEVKDSDRVTFSSLDISSDGNKIFEILETISNCDLDFIHFAYTENLNKEKELLASVKKLAEKQNIDMRLFFLSSAAVYGDQEETPIYESAKLEPVSNYGKFKLQLENFIIKEFDEYLILRLANPFGKEFFLKGAYAHFLNSLKQQMKEGKTQLEIAINADAPNQIIRDLVYIDDFSNTLFQLLNNDMPFKEILNISSAKASYLEDLAFMAFSELLKEEQKLEYSLSFRYNGFKTTDIKKSVLANDKLLNLLEKSLSV